jgi:WD40 repeat protein
VRILTAIESWKRTWTVFQGVLDAYRAWRRVPVVELADFPPLRPEYLLGSSATTKERLPTPPSSSGRNVETGALIQELKHGQPVSDCCLSYDGKTLVTVEHGKLDVYGEPAGDATVTIRNAETGAPLREYKSEQPVTSSSLSTDGKTLVYMERSRQTSTIIFKNTRSRS